MVVRDLFQVSDDVRVIARAIYEDQWKPEEVDGWITKYYAQLMKLKNSKVRKSDTMLFLSVVNESGHMYGDVGGYSYKDIKKGCEIGYAVEDLNCRCYASLYVPDYTVQRYGAEVVAAEALREYGWNGYDERIICPDAVREKILQTLPGMESGIFLVDEHYFERCKQQFCKAYEGKEVPQWEDVKTADGVEDHRGWKTDFV